jgi:Alginate lyase
MSLIFKKIRAFVAKYIILNRTLLHLLAGLLLCLQTAAAQQRPPETLVLNGTALLQNKQAIANGDALRTAALQNLKRNADKLLKETKTYAVTNKTITPPSGDKHDYMSQAPYWWPDPTKPNGLPYIRKDGERNPELNQISDHEELDHVEDASETLALAWFFTQDERYAEKAAELLKTWFLNPATRQNPNLNFAQGIPGINKGRGIGLIETRQLYRVADAAILLQGAKVWSEADHRALKQWFSAFLTWMQTSDNGKDEADEHNNHGTWYDVQIVTFALFTGQNEIAKQQLETTKQRIASQFKPDGSQPHELARTTSWSYVNMNLTAFFTLARLAEHLNIDLWRFETSDAKNLRKGVDWLVPYLKNEQTWTYQQIKTKSYDDTIRLLKTAAKTYENPEYEAIAKQTDERVYNHFFCQLAY